MATSTLPNDLGNVAVVDEPDVPCVQNTLAARVDVYTAGSGPRGFDRLELVGGGWLASGASAGGFVLFDGSGAGAGAEPAAVGDQAHVAASTGLTIAAAGISAGSVLFQAHDASGAVILPAVPVGTTDGHRVAVGGAKGSSLVVWQEGGVVQAVGISETGNVELPFDLGSGLVAASVAAGVAPAPAGFAVGWSGQGGPAQWVTSFALATVKGLTAAAQPVVVSPRAHRLVQMGRSSAGHVLLFEGEDPAAPAVYVLPVGPEGESIGPAHRFLGAVRGWALAALGDKLGLIATRADDTLAFRPLEGLGGAAGPWVCLGAPSADPANIGAVSALPTGDGFRILAPAVGGGVATFAVDPTGAGVP